jgi:glycosyltransferase involved in cell wall biosynthesis
MDQTVREIEILVVGDGAGAGTEAAVSKLAKYDGRIRYFGFPKGERHGEANRHAVLASASGKYIAYLCHDDLWLPDHLANLALGLEHADFVHTIHTPVILDGSIKPLLTDLEQERFVTAMLRTKSNWFGPTTVGHSMSAYRKLPHGWHPAPPEVWSDLHMWRQFLSTEGLRCRTIPHCDTLHFASPLRTAMTPEMRENELRKAYEWSRTPAGQIEYRNTTAWVNKSFHGIRRVLDLQSLNKPNAGPVTQDVLQEQLAALNELQFDQDYYLSQHADVQKGGMNASLHFVLHGIREQRDHRFNT